MNNLNVWDRVTKLEQKVFGTERPKEKEKLWEKITHSVRTYPYNIEEISNVAIDEILKVIKDVKMPCVCSNNYKDELKQRLEELR